MTNPWLLLMPALVAACCACTPPAPPAQAAASLPDSTLTPQDQLRALGLQIQAKPQDYALRYDRSQLYYQLDSLRQAVSDADAALGLFPQSPDLHYWRGFLAYAQSDTARAMQGYREAARLGSQEPEVYYQMGQLFFFQEKYPQALAYYRKAMEFNDAEPMYVFAQGFLEERRGSRSEAVRHYRRAIELDSNFAKAYTQLHDLYLARFENEDEAMRYNALLLRRQPTHPLASFNLGSYHLRRAMNIDPERRPEEFGRHLNEAVAQFTIASNKDPGFLLAWYNRGYSYYLGRQRMQEAIESFGKVLEIKPDYAPACFMLGSIYEQAGDLQTALGYYRQALQYQPDGDGFREAVLELESRLR
ncbi:MAG: tetratricopeptide repeat protein [Bacteroidia bacterium]|nr:tetratricopeptide repeat protein [Bacteroidia bacterium]